MKFRVQGAKKDTGDDIEIQVVATDSKHAEHIAVGRGIMVAAIKPIAEEVNLDPIDLEPEAAADGHASAAPAERDPAASQHSAPAATAHDTAHDTAHGTAHDPAHDPAHDTGHDTAHGTPHAAHPGTHMEYKLLQNQALYLLERTVNKLLVDGWEPQGGLTIAIQNNAPNYFQAVIRKPKAAATTP